jgi:hypothetical protein
MRAGVVVFGQPGIRSQSETPALPITCVWHAACIYPWRRWFE